MVADGLPFLAFNILNYVQADSTYNTFSQNRASPYIISNLLKIVIGYFMMADNRLIINFIERKSKEAIVNDGSE